MSPLTTQPPTPVLLPVHRLFHYDAETQMLFMDIDNTSLEHFAVCARSAKHRLVDSREGTTNMAAKRYGSAKHLYLEARAKGESVEASEKIMCDYLAAFPLENPDEWRTVSHAIDSVRAYERHWAAAPLEPAVVNGKPIVELGFRLPLCDIDSCYFTHNQLLTLCDNPDQLGPALDRDYTIRVFWTGRIDMIAAFLDEHFVVDHKTTSMGGPQFYEEFNLSSQTLGYVWAAGHLFPDLAIRGLRVNVLLGRKPTKTGVAHDFARQTFIYSLEHLTEWHQNTQTLVTDFVSHLLRSLDQASPVPFPMQTKWCQGKYGTCQYFSVCTAVPVSRPLVLASDLFQDVTWSPLHER